MGYEPKPGMPIEAIDTPALLLDQDAFEYNLRSMARFFVDRPTALRPHAKTHKCPQIALRQLAAGAIGITCAKVGEAEVLAQAGVRDLLIANQVVGSIKIDRLTALAAESDPIVAVDAPENVVELSQACRAKGVGLRVVVEVDIGMHRCGVQPGEPVLALARHVADAPALEFAGLLAYEGHLVMVPDAEERARRLRAALDVLGETCDLLADAGLPPRIVSGGGTGTYDVSGTYPPMTEIEAGSYVFMDTRYLTIRPEFRPALTVLATVISRPAVERIVVDAGMKTMTKEFGWPEPLDMPGLTVLGLSEEHGTLDVLNPSVNLHPGDKVRFVPSHGCTTTNLHDRLHVVKDGVLVDVWPILARGRAQ